LKNRIVDYINSYLNKIRIVVNDFINNRITEEQFKEIIAKANTNLSKKVPAFVARDITGLYVSLLAGELFNYLGIQNYQWQTAGDERVRGNPDGLYPKAVPSHYDMDGLVCRNNDSTIYSSDSGRTWKMRNTKMPMLHPGEDYNCRCIRAVHIESFLRPIDKEIDNASRDT